MTLFRISISIRMGIRIGIRIKWGGIIPNSMRFANRLCSLFVVYFLAFCLDFAQDICLIASSKIQSKNQADTDPLKQMERRKLLKISQRTSEHFSLSAVVYFIEQRKQKIKQATKKGRCWLTKKTNTWKLFTHFCGWFVLRRWDGNEREYRTIIQITHSEDKDHSYCFRKLN